MATTSARIGIKFDGAQSIKDVANNLLKANQAALKAAGSFDKLSKSEKITYETNKKLAASLKATEAALKAQAEGMKKLSTSSDKVAKSTKQVQIAMAGMARSVGVATLSYSALLPLMSGMVIGSAVKKVYELGAAFEYTATYVEALGDSLSGLDAGGIQSSLLDIEGLRKGPLELAAGMKEFAKAGVDAAESLRQIGEMSKFATVAEIGLAEANKLVIGQSKAFGIEFTEAANMISAAALSSATDIEELGNALSYTTELATVTNTTFDEVATAMAIMANAGIRGSKAGTAIRTSLLKMATPTEGLRKKFDALGISWTAFTDDGKIKSMKSMFTELKRVTDNLPDAQRVGILKDLFGLRALKGGANILRAQGEEWDKLNMKIREAGENGEFLSDTYEKLADTTTAKWERLGVEIEKSLIKAFQSEAVKEGIGNLTDFVASEGFQQDIKVVVEGLNTIGVALTGLLSLVNSLPGDITDLGLVGYAILGKSPAGRIAAVAIEVNKLGKELNAAVAMEGADKESGMVGFMARVQKWQKELILGWEEVELAADGAMAPTTETETFSAGLDIPNLTPGGFKTSFIQNYNQEFREGIPNLLSSFDEVAQAKRELERVLQTTQIKTETKAQYAEWAEAEKAKLDTAFQQTSRGTGSIRMSEAELFAEQAHIGTLDVKSAALAQVEVKYRELFAEKKLSTLLTKEEVKLSQDLLIAKGKEISKVLSSSAGYDKQTDSFMGANAARGRAIELMAIEEGLADKLNKTLYDQRAVKTGDMFMGMDEANKRAEDMLNNVENLQEETEGINFESSLIGLSEFDAAMKRAVKETEVWADSAGLGFDDPRTQDHLKALQNAIIKQKEFNKTTEEAALAADKAMAAQDEWNSALEEHNKLVKDTDYNLATSGLSSIEKLYADIAREAKEYGVKATAAGKDGATATEEHHQALLRAKQASGELLEVQIQAAREGENVWKGFSAGLLEAIQNTKTLGDLGYDLAGQFTSGLKGTFSAIFKGEFDTIGDLWKTTLNSMLDSVIDWAAQAASEFVIEQSVDFLFGEGTAAKMGLGSGPTGAKGDPVYVTMDGMSGGEAASKASGTSSALSNLFEMGTAWDTIATGLGDGLNSALDDSWFINESGSSFDNAWWNTATVDDFFDYGTSAMDAGSSQWDNIFTQDPGTGTAWDNVLGDITFDDMLADTETSWSSTMDSIKTTWETVKPAIGAAAGAYGIYSGIEQGGVGGTFQAAGGAMSMYTAGVDAGLYEASAMMGTAGAALGAAGGLYGVYQGVESGNYVQAAGGAVQAYQGANALAPEIGTAISEGFGSLTGGLIGTTAASTAAATGGAYAATSAASTAAQLAAAESAAAAGGAAMSSMAGPIGMAVAMGMAIYQSETEDKFEYESSYGGFEVAEKGQDRGSALIRSMDTIMEDLALSVEAGASAVNYVPDEMVQRANQHLEVLWTEFGEGMAGMALAVEPSLNSFDQYVQATTNAHLSTQELSWMMEKATEASFGNIEAVQSLEYYMVTLGQSTVEASVSAAGMISAMGEASTGMTVAGQIYYTTLAQMAAGTSDFDGTVRELQATMGITDEVTRDLSGTLEGAAGKLDSYGNVITDVGGDASEASTYMEQFGSAVRGMSDEAIAAANAFNGIVMQAPQGYSERGAQGNYNKDGAVYSYHASGGVMNRPTVFHVGGEAGDEAILPLHNGPNTLKLMDDKIDALANRPVQVTIVGDEAGLRKFIRVESDDLVTSKLQRGQGTERVEF